MAQVAHRTRFASGGTPPDRGVENSFAVFNIGKWTIIFLSFAILRGVDHVHAKKAMETNPTAKIFCVWDTIRISF